MQDESHSPEGWHKADIVRALKLKGFTQRKLSQKHKLSPSAVSVCLVKRWPRVEKIIARTIGVPAHVIWPPRYHRRAVPIKRGCNKESRRNGCGSSATIPTAPTGAPRLRAGSA